VTSQSEASLIAEVMLEQCRELSRQIQTYTHSADKYFGLATTLTVATITVALSNKFELAVVGLPFALGGLMLYVVQLMTERAARVGMKRYLEDALREMGYAFALEERCLDRVVSERRASVKFSTALYACGYLATCVFSVLAAANYGDHGRWLVVVTVVLLIVLSAGVATAVVELQRADGEAYRFLAYSVSPSPDPTARVTDHPLLRE
jgi:hypothetical protein